MFRPDGTPAAGPTGAASSTASASETHLQRHTQQQLLMQQHKAAAASGPVPPVPAWAREPPVASVSSGSSLRQPQWLDTMPKVHDPSVIECLEADGCLHFSQVAVVIQHVQLAALGQPACTMLVMLSTLLVTRDLAVMPEHQMHHHGVTGRSWRRQLVCLQMPARPVWRRSVCCGLAARSLLATRRWLRHPAMAAVPAATTRAVGQVSGWSHALQQLPALRRLAHPAPRHQSPAW
jgi:hypothetical protein